MQEQTREKGGWSSAGLLIAIATGIGAATAAILLAKKFGEGKAALTLDHLLKGCDEAASKLDDRIRLAG